MDKKSPSTELLELYQRMGSDKISIASAATQEMAKALELPLRQGIMPGNIFSGIFAVENLGPGVAPEYPLDFLAPGSEKEFVAFTIPSHGMMPEKHVESTYVMVPTFEIGATIYWLQKYARDARWNVFQRAMQVLEAMMVKKMNDSCWHALLAGGVDRNAVVFDSDATAGNFTKRLVSLMKTYMRRNGGGNSASNMRSRLTDLYISPEAQEDMRNWGVDIVDEVTRREIFLAGDGVMSRIFQVNLHDLDELGESQEYQLYFTNDLAGSMGASDVEIVVGLDLSTNDSFVMPVREVPSVMEDDQVWKQRKIGLLSRAEYGVGVLDNRRILIGSL